MLSNFRSFQFAGSEFRPFCGAAQRAYTNDTMLPSSCKIKSLRDASGKHPQIAANSGQYWT